MQAVLSVYFVSFVRNANIARMKFPPLVHGNLQLVIVELRRRVQLFHFFFSLHVGHVAFKRFTRKAVFLLVLVFEDLMQVYLLEIARRLLNRFKRAHSSRLRGPRD